MSKEKKNSTSTKKATAITKSQIKPDPKPDRVARHQDSAAKKQTR
jgi:hypothetical protein